MASITQTVNGRWRVRVRLKEGRHASKTFRTKADAKDWAASEERDIHHRQQRDFRKAEKLLVREMLERYEREKGVAMKSAEVLTYRGL